MKGQMLMAALLASGVMAEEAAAEPRWSFPDAVRAIEALNEKLAGEPWCADHDCLQQQTGSFLFLDLFGPPAWRRVDSFYHFTGAPGSEWYSDVYLNLDGRGSQKERHFWYPIVGMLFDAKQLPDITPGELTDIHIAGDEMPFVFNGTTYQLRFDKRCREGSSFGGRRFYADMSIVLISDGKEQTISTSLNPNDPGPAYTTCDDAKDSLPILIRFDFSGDLDGDGKLDLVFLKNGGGFFPTVFSSRYAEPGQLMKEFDSNESC